MRLWVRKRWSRRSIAADYSMPCPFGKPCAPALDGIVPRPPQRQGTREVAARSATAARVVQTVPCGYPALAGGCRAESSAVWAEVIFAENINAGKKRAGLRRPFVVETCGVLYGNIVTGPNGLNVAEPV